GEVLLDYRQQSVGYRDKIGVGVRIYRKGIAMAKQANEPTTEITPADVDRFCLLRPLIGALHRDIQELAKKKQDGALTKARISMINRLLKDIKELLAKQPSSAYIDLLDE